MVKKIYLQNTKDATSNVECSKQLSDSGKVIQTECDLFNVVRGDFYLYYINSLEVTGRADNVIKVNPTNTLMSLQIDEKSEPEKIFALLTFKKKEFPEIIFSNKTGEYKAPFTIIEKNTLKFDITSLGKKSYLITSKYPCTKVKEKPLIIFTDMPEFEENRRRIWPLTKLSTVEIPVIERYPTNAIDYAEIIDPSGNSAVIYYEEDFEGFKIIVKTENISFSIIGDYQIKFHNVKKNKAVTYTINVNDRKPQVEFNRNIFIIDEKKSQKLLINARDVTNLYIKKGTVYNELNIINQNELINSDYAPSEEEKVYLAYSIDYGKEITDINTPIFFFNNISSLGSFNLKTCWFNKRPYDTNFTLYEQNEIDLSKISFGIYQDDTKLDNLLNIKGIYTIKVLYQKDVLYQQSITFTDVSLLENESTVNREGYANIYYNSKCPLDGKLLIEKDTLKCQAESNNQKKCVTQKKYNFFGKAHPYKMYFDDYLITDNFILYKNLENADIQFSITIAILDVGSYTIYAYSEDYNVKNFKKIIFSNSLGQDAIICSQGCDSLLTAEEDQIKFSLSFTQTITQYTLKSIEDKFGMTINTFKSPVVFSLSGGSVAILNDYILVSENIRASFKILLHSKATGSYSVLEITTPSGKTIPTVDTSCVYNSPCSLMTIDDYNWGQTGYETNAVPLKFIFKVGTERKFNKRKLRYETIILKYEAVSLNKVVLVQKLAVPKYFSIALPSTVMKDETFDIELTEKITVDYFESKVITITIMKGTEAGQCTFVSLVREDTIRIACPAEYIAKKSSLSYTFSVLSNTIVISDICSEGTKPSNGKEGPSCVLDE